MTPTEIKKFKRSDEYYEMSRLGWDSLTKIEEEKPEKVYLVDDARMDLKNQCDTLNKECREEGYNGDDTKTLNYMSAVDNAMDTEGIEEGSLRYYSVILGSYEELRNQ